MVVPVSAVNVDSPITENVVPSHRIAPRSLAVVSITAPAIFVAPVRGKGFVRRVTQECGFEPIAAFEVEPQVFGAVNARYAIWAEVVPHTRSPLPPVDSQAKSATRFAAVSVAPSWVWKFAHPLPFQ